jgi:hypothetical protein
MLSPIACAARPPRRRRSTPSDGSDGQRKPRGQTAMADCCANKADTEAALPAVMSLFAVKPAERGSSSGA